MLMRNLLELFRTRSYLDKCGQAVYEELRRSASWWPALPKMTPEDIAAHFDKFWQQCVKAHQQATQKATKVIAQTVFTDKDAFHAALDLHHATIDF